MVSIFVVFAVVFLVVLAFSSDKKQTVVRSVAPEEQRERLKKCPQCAEFVQPEAKICRFCRHDFTSSEDSIDSISSAQSEPRSANIEVLETTGPSPAQTAARTTLLIVIGIPALIILALLVGWLSANLQGYDFK